MPEEKAVSIPAGRSKLEANLTLPKSPLGLVLFAHGSGSSRLSPRNRHVAAMLNDANLATLLMDLLTASEERIDELTGELRFDIDLLGRRLLAAAGWIAGQPALARLPLGFFGASTGAAAALLAAAERPSVGAVVSRGGRPDLAGDYLPRVQAPTLLIVGGQDPDVLDVNQKAATYLRCQHRVVIVPGATHLFEEPGALDQVSQFARDWFTTHFTGVADRVA